MAEEKKEELQKPAPEAAAQKAPEAPAPGAEAPKAEVKAAAPEQAKAAPEKKEAAPKEKPANCASCNKSIKNKRWYYRSGKYYCAKRCWQTASKKEKAPEAQATPQQ